MSLAAHWTLDPGTTFLNHGSFGACPAVVLEVQRELQARIEKQPLRFFLRELPALLEAARVAAASCLGAAADDLALVTNATSGVNTVLRSLTFGEGDELLRTTQGYAACNNAMDFVAGRSGARVVVAQVPFPLESDDQVMDAVLAAVTPRTRLALIDQVTSPTGVVLPVDRLVSALHQRGVEVMVDAAHGPGLVDLHLDRTGAEYTTGNFHKWLCTPKGAAFLHVRRDRQDRIRPLVISHGASTGTEPGPVRFRAEFEWTGTQDPSPWLCIEPALKFLEGVVPGGLAEVRRRNRELALEARAILCRALGVPPPAPDSMIAALAAVPVPPGKVERTSPFQPDPLQEALYAAGFEVPIVPWRPRLIRVAAQIYNDRTQYERLAAALPGLLAQGL